MLSSNLASETLDHEATDGIRIVGIVTLKEHQFGNGTLNSLIVTTNDTSFLKMVSTVVTRHLDSTLHALTDIDDHLTITRTFF